MDVEIGDDTHRVKLPLSAERSGEIVSVVFDLRFVAVTEERTRDEKIGS
jgi:hypothetical protein